MKLLHRQPLNQLIQKRQEIYGDYKRVESGLLPGTVGFNTFEECRQWDLDKIKKSLDHYDAVIDLLS